MPCLVLKYLVSFKLEVYTMKAILKLNVFFALLFFHCSVNGVNYYVNSVTGSDTNSGVSSGAAFATLKRVSMVDLQPGDTIFLAKGLVYRGSLELKNVEGTSLSPIVVSSYRDQKTGSDQLPLIDATGYYNGVLLENCSYIQVKNIAITASGIGDGLDEEGDMRCGVLVNTSREGDYQNIRLEDLLIRDVFFENPGYERGADEVRTANGTQRYGWGIRVINRTQGALINDVFISNCTITNVAHTGIKFTAFTNGIQNIGVYYNKVYSVGGPGIQFSGVHQAHVAYNRVSHSGSDDDSRKWGRGSGLWTWGSSDFIIEHNEFLHANGPGDSAGCHIDYNCHNIIVQYNLSANNAGGFIEVLGNNYNCAYRYNVSINDGHRVRGERGAFQEGKVFWLSGYQGNRPRFGPFNSYFYNNTIYVHEEIESKFAVTNSAEGVMVANNIFYIKGNTKTVLGDQNRPDAGGDGLVKNLVFSNNLYLNSGVWPDDVVIQDQSPIFGSPEFVNPGGSQIRDYMPTNLALTAGNGIPIHALPGDDIGLFTGLDVDYDILGNKILGKPFMGAIQVAE